MTISVAPGAAALPADQRAVLAKVEERTRSRRHADGSAFVVGIRGEPDAWTGPAEHVLDNGWTLTVVPSGSVLAVLDALARWEPTPKAVLAVLTDLAESDLGDAILARLDGDTLYEADRHTLLENILRTRNIDPRIRKEVWLVDALIDLAHDGQLRPLLGTSLTRRRALSLVARSRLDTDPESADLADLVLRLNTAGIRDRWRALDPATRAGLRDYLVMLLGAPAGLLLDLADSRDEPLADLLAVQPIVAARALPQPTHLAIEAYGRATQSRFGTDPGREVLTTLTDAGLAAARRHAAPEAMFARADAMLDELAAAGLAVHSPVLARGHVERLATAAADLTEETLATVAAHDRHRAEPHRHARLHAALRLRRWLASEPSTEVDGIGDGLCRHARELAWVDRALQQVQAGDADPRVASTLRSTALAVADVRAEIDLAFAGRLAHAPETPAELLAVETVLARRVAPLVAKGQDVVLVVVDGMSGAVAGDLVEALADQGWIEMVASDDGDREAVLAALPTETQYSRSSLLRGRLVRGRDDRERAEFPDLPHWSGRDVRIVHKAGVAGDVGADLGIDLDAALAPDSGCRLVAVVLNAVDDCLPKGRASSDPRWTPRDVPGLEGVLARARDTGRAVILVSDHGHVVESGSQLRTSPGGGARWRPEGEVAPDEVLVSGPRVLTESGRAVLAAVERLRYGKSSAGYHGGATLAEVAIPLIGLLPPGVDELPGWIPRTVAAPAWWTGTTSPAPVADVTTASPPSTRKPPRRRVAPVQSEGLFDAPAEVPTPAPAPPTPASRGRALIATKTFRDAHAAAGAAVPSPETFAAVVDTVLDAGGRVPASTAAAAAERPVARLRGLISVMARVLNRDSFPVMTLIDHGKTVAVDRALLDDQFPVTTR